MSGLRLLPPLLAALFATLAALCAGPAAAERYVFLGDSLVDNHNSYIATTLLLPGNISPPSPPYYDGRFSNGLNWSDRLAPGQLFYMNYYFSQPDCAAENGPKGIAGFCGATAAPGAQAGASLGFAFGGSRSGYQDLPGAAPGLLTVLDDLAAYRAAGVVADTRGATFALLTGGNDYTYYVATGGGGLSEAAAVAQTLGEIGVGLTKMAALGGRRAIVLNLFDLNRVPTLINDFSAAQLAQSGRLSTLHNAGLPATLAAARTATGMEILLVDLEALYDDIHAHPARYGFTNTTGSCITSDVTHAVTGQCPDAASEAATLFWDGQHPTTAAHRYIYELVAATVGAVDEDGGRLAALPDSSLLLLQGLHGALRSGTATTVEEEGRTLFLGGVAGDGERGADGAFAGYDYRLAGLVGGVAYTPERFGRELRLGLHLGHLGLDGEIGGGGSFRQAGTGLGLSAGRRLGDLEWNARASLMHLSVDEIERRTRFTVLPTARGESEGWGGGLELEALLHRPLPQWAGVGEAAGLTLGGRLTANRAELEGYNERDAEFLDLRVADSQLSELRAGVELDLWRELPTRAGRLRAHLALGLDRDLLDEPRRIDAALPSGQSLHAESHAPGRTRLHLDGGLRLWRKQALQVELGLAVTFEEGGGSEVRPQLTLGGTF